MGRNLFEAVILDHHRRQLRQVEVTTERSCIDRDVEAVAHEGE
jgi:hypothetical protein